MRGGLLICALLVGCGGGDDESGEPLLSGSLSGDYDGAGFTPANGFATVLDQTPLIALGDGPIRCGTEDDNDPPSGTNAALSIPMFEAGDYTSVLVLIYQNVDEFEGTGSNVGSVSLTSVSEESIAGSVEYEYTDDQDRHFSLSGTFDVVRCAP